jgi:hypothetical protein
MIVSERKEPAPKAMTSDRYFHLNQIEKERKIF